MPPLTTSFEVNLFNTYRAFRFPDMFPVAPQVHADQRGDLFETVRAHGGTGQAFVSTTVPGRCAATTTTCTRWSGSSW